MAGVNGFLEFAFSGKEDSIVLKCPCMKCNLFLYHDRATMWEHLMAYGILGNYNPWVHHGETVNASDRSVDKYEEDALVIVVYSSSDEDMTPLVVDTTNVMNSNTLEGAEHDLIVCINTGRGTSTHQSMYSRLFASVLHAPVNSKCSAQNTRNSTLENHGTAFSEDASGVTLTIVKEVGYNLQKRQLDGCPLEICSICV